MKTCVFALALVAAGAAVAQSGPIKIGEINSYSSIPQFTGPYRQGWQLDAHRCRRVRRHYGRSLCTEGSRRHGRAHRHRCGERDSGDKG